MSINEEAHGLERRKGGDRRRPGGGRPPFVERRKGERRRSESIMASQRENLLHGKRIAFIGCGNMGEALLSGCLSTGMIRRDAIVVTDIKAERLEYITRKENVMTTTNNKEAVQMSDIIVLAVKPQVLEEVLRQIKEVITPDKLVISIAAGIRTEFIEKILEKRIPVVRVMPNISCQVKAGASAVCAGQYAGEDEELVTEQIMRLVGTVIRVPEDMFDAITSLSGSGPAYVFYIIEAFIRAGVELGLSEHDARELTIQTVYGATRMLQETGETPQVLRRKVTSPGGTTEAGLKYLEQKALAEILGGALKEALKRAKELGNGR